MSQNESVHCTVDKADLWSGIKLCQCGTHLTVLPPENGQERERERAREREREWERARLPTVHAVARGGVCVQICHQKGVMVLIDLAHALGQAPLNIPNIRAEFYVASGHKWLYSPKGSAILWVARDKQHLIHPKGMDMSSSLNSLRAVKILGNLSGPPHSITPSP